MSTWQQRGREPRKMPPGVPAPVTLPLPAWYADLYRAAEVSTEYRRVCTAKAAAMAHDVAVVPLTTGDFLLAFNLLACWVNEGEPTVAPTAPSGHHEEDGASDDVPPACRLSAEAERDRNPYGTIAAELPLTALRIAFLRFVVAYNTGAVPPYYWLRQGRHGAHHEPHPTADVPPPLGLCTTYEWEFAKTENGLATALRAEEAYGHAVVALSQRPWADLMRDDFV
jgi:hypothetical protein